MPFKPTFYNTHTDDIILTVPIDASTVDGAFFIADRKLRVLSIKEAHAVAGTDAGTVTLAVKKASGTTAPASGTAVHSGTINLKGTANTVQSATIVAADATLASGDRLCLDVTGTLTALAGGALTVVLRPA